MIDATERKGFGLSVAGHILLLGVLSVGALFRSVPPHLPPESMDVQLVGPVGLHAAQANPSPEPPAESQAPEVGPPVEAAVPPPPQPKPQSEPKPKPEAVPDTKSVPKPTPAKPAPPKREKLTDDILKDIKATASKEKKPTGARLGADFLKGLTSDKTAGKSQTPRATLSGIQMRGLASAIAQKVKPCYVIPTGGADASSIVSILRLRFNRDGSVAGTPTVTDHQGVTGANQSYVRQMDDAAIRAVLRCSPLQGLPPELYEGGWEDIEFTFSPSVMR